MNLVSIIVPVYNAEKYFDKCIESLIHQTHKDLEIILVNDGSTDMSGAKCEKWGKVDPRIRVNHKENGGTASARNVGMKHAQGQFVAFVDADDWLEPNAIELMLNGLLENQCDMAICDMLIYYSDAHITSKQTPKKIMLRHEAMKNHLDRGYLCNNSVCNKLFRRNILNNLLFIEDQYYEDTTFMHEALNRCGKVINIGVPLYYHNQHEGSKTHAPVSEKSFDLVKAYIDKLELVKKNYPDLTVYAQSKLTVCCLDFINNVLFHRLDQATLVCLKKQAYTILKGLPVHLFPKRKDVCGSTRSRMQHLIIKLSANLYECVYYLIKGKRYVPKK